MNARSAYPTHFFDAIEHGLLLIQAGMPKSMLSIMSNKCQTLGLIDAASGYDHVILMLMTLDF